MRFTEQRTIRNFDRPVLYTGGVLAIHYYYYCPLLLSSARPTPRHPPWATT